MQHRAFTVICVQEKENWNGNSVWNSVQVGTLSSPISNLKAMVKPAWEIGVGGILILWNVDVVVRPVKAFALTPDFKHLKQTIWRLMPQYLGFFIPCLQNGVIPGGLFWTSKLGKIATLQEKQKTFLGQRNKVNEFFY